MIDITVPDIKCPHCGRLIPKGFLPVSYDKKTGRQGLCCSCRRYFHLGIFKDVKPTAKPRMTKKERRKERERLANERAKKVFSTAAGKTARKEALIDATTDAIMADAEARFPRASA